MAGLLEPGELLGNRYRVLDLLGRGGMGLVYAARDVRTEVDVAIKLLRPELRDRARTVSRFQREARALARLRSPHVVRVTDVDALADGTPFFVMERLEGRTLAFEIRARERLPVGEAIGYVVQAAHGTQAAHEQGIVHRDLKPENLFLVGEPGRRTVKVLDFGISKLDAQAALRVTETDTSLGTPAYMSPEQLRSAKHVDIRSDVWSLGVIAYELLTGRLPFGIQDSPAVARAIVSVAPAPIRELAPEVPAELAAVVERALRKDPADRPRDARALAVALEPFALAELKRPELTLTRPSRPPERAFSAVPEPGDTHRDTPASGSLPFRPPRVPAPALWRLALIGGAVGVLFSLVLHYLRHGF